MPVSQKCIAGTDPKLIPGKPPVTVRVSLFFDGTLNNRTNTGLRVTKKATASQLESTSFLNDYSNVAKLEWALKPAIPGYDFSQKIYVEGIGTDDGNTDSLAAGASTGTGDTGIVAKVDRGLQAAIDSIQLLVASDVPITYIHLDSFGFSRGAAGARHFVNKALKGKTALKTRLEASGYTVGSVKFRFTGLFDTVASYGAKHSNDTSELNLDAIVAVDKVVQLAAAEEHRVNFRLTNINSAGAKGKQFFLPGVHSDIGGGYVDMEGDSVQLLDIDSVGWNSKEQKAAIARERQWAVAQGWYHTDELAETTTWNEIDANRPMIRNTYSRIPLQMMAKFATELGLVFGPDLQKKYWIPPDLSKVNAFLESYVAGGGTSKSSDWFHKVTPMLFSLRHSYLHFSATYGDIANAPQWSNGDPITGTRERIIQNG